MDPERRCDLQRLNSYQISGQAINDKDTGKEDVEAQDEVQNQGSLTSSFEFFSDLTRRCDHRRSPLRLCSD